MPATTALWSGIEAPGDPGIITPEDDVLDTSYENRKN